LQKTEEAIQKGQFRNIGLQKHW